MGGKVAGRWILGGWMLATAALSSVHAADFAGAGAAIPDNSAVGVNIPFAVSGIATPVGRVRIALNLTHTFIGDVRATLISPGGVARLVLFSQVGYRRSGTSGVSANFSGNYVFDDLASGDLWQVTNGMNTAQNAPTGTYRTSTASNQSQSNHGGCTTYLSMAFAGLAGAQVNGTWTLNLADLGATDTGALNSALLTIDPPVQLFTSGFEDGVPGPEASSVRGSCTRAFFDYTGRGLSSYAVVRNTGGGPSGAITWFVQDNDGTATGAQQNFVHGTSSDQFVDGDYDGDGITDATVWRASAGAFLVRRSSRPTDAVQTIVLGTTSDSPRNVGDFDGDGITDAAVYRNGASAGLPSQTLIRLSSTGALRILTTGEATSFPSGGVDYSGDGVADAVVQSNGGGGVGRFRIFHGVTGAQIADFNYGLPTDVIVTGNFVGSALADVTVIRGVSGSINWETRDTGTGVGQPTVIFGASATDFVLAGDYDGDGLSDVAIWRPSATVGQSKFSIRRSSTLTTLDVFVGQNGDYPVGNSRTN